jgi:hypothetical protein
VSAPAELHMVHLRVSVDPGVPPSMRVERALWRHSDGRPELVHRHEIEHLMEHATDEDLVSSWLAGSDVRRLSDRDRGIWSDQLQAWLLEDGAPAGWTDTLSDAERIVLLVDATDRLASLLPYETVVAPDLRRKRPPLVSDDRQQVWRVAAPAATLVERVPTRRLGERHVVVLRSSQGFDDRADIDNWARTLETGWSEKDGDRPPLRRQITIEDVYDRHQAREIEPPVEALERMLDEQPEVLVLWGHGDAAAAGSGRWPTLSASPVLPEKFAEQLAGARPDLVVLATCDGATSAADGSPSLAAAAAVAGVPWSVGFNGKIDDRTVAKVVQTLLDGVADGADPADDRPLTRWFDDLGSARAAAGAAADNLVVHVGREHLAGRCPSVLPPALRLGLHRRGSLDDERAVEVTEAVAHLAIVAEPEGPGFRIPLCVDRPEPVTLSAKDGRLQLRGAQRCTPDEVPEEITDWLGPVEIEPTSVDVRWATVAGDLVGLLTAAERLFDTIAPGEVRTAIAQQVDADLATWGSGPMAIELGTGRVRREFAGFPPGQPDIMGTPDTADPANLDRALPTLSWDDIEADLEAALAGDIDAFAEVLARQRKAFYHSQVPHGRAVVALRQRRTVAYLPWLVSVRLPDIGR